ncbi:MAG: polysaccharide deacetylase family protein [Bacillaceae bacterium]|nr:polysaccharide deacetylase family protein [Bacillaceae bacterium]
MNFRQNLLIYVALTILALLTLTGCGMAGVHWETPPAIAVDEQVNTGSSAQLNHVEKSGNHPMTTGTETQSTSPQLDKDSSEAREAHPIHYRNQVVVLTYHHISRDFTSNFTITPQKFRSHVELLHDEGFQPIHFDTFVHFLETGHLKEENAVLITFDDGYESYYRYAFPVLQDYQFPSVQFVVPSKLKYSPERGEGVISTLSFYQMKQLLASELVSVQSHTYALHAKKIDSGGKHIPVTAPDPENERHEVNPHYQGRLYVDLMMAKAGLEQKLGREVTALSFPYGFYNSRMIEMAQKAGYQYGFTTREGAVIAGTNPLLIPRIHAGTPDVDPQTLKEMILLQVEADKE